MEKTNDTPGIPKEFHNMKSCAGLDKCMESVYN